MSHADDLAKAIGARSKNKDWQFVAKHWDKIPNEDVHKQELLRLGEGVANDVPGSRVYHGYNARISMGDWFWYGTTRIGQVVWISYDGKRIGIVWYGEKKSFTGITSYPASDVLSNFRLGKSPFEA